MQTASLRSRLCHLADSTEPRASATMEFELLLSAPTVKSLTQDLRFAFRILRRSPAFTCVAILSLGLGIGANTAIFTMVDALLLRNIPVKQPKQLVIFGAGNKSGITDDFPNGKS